MKMSQLCWYWFMIAFFGGAVYNHSWFAMGCGQIQGVLVVMGTLVVLGENLGGRTSETGVGKFEIWGVGFFLYISPIVQMPTTA